MSELYKELRVLDMYLTTCQKKEFLLEGVWLAFKHKEKNPTWDILKCFETAIWDWLLSESKKDNSSDLAQTTSKIEKINKKIKSKDVP